MICRGPSPATHQRSKQRLPLQLTSVQNSVMDTRDLID
jgi:hypothetical protein